MVRYFHLRGLENWLFTGLVVLHLLPVWLVPVAPTQDGPSHLSMAHALRQLGEPGGEYLGEYFVRNEEPLPNRFDSFLLVEVLGALPLPLAEKILLSFYVILLPVSARFALRSVRPEAGYLAFLVFPFTYSYLLNMGFYNFCLSLVSFFLSLALWLRRGGPLGAGRTAGLAAMVLWTYFCHPVTVAVLVGSLLTLASWRTLLELRGGGGPRALRWLAGPTVACAPAIFLLAAFLIPRLDGPVSDMSFTAKVLHLGALYSLVSLDGRLVVFSVVLAAAMGLLAASAVGVRLRLRRRLLPDDGLLLVSVLLVGVYFVAPNEMGQGGFLTHRLNLFPFLFLVLWLGAARFPERWKEAVRGLGAALSMGLLAAMLALWSALGTQMSDILTAVGHIEPRSTLLSLSFANAGQGEDGSRLAMRTWPFVHAGGHLAARLPLADLGLYEANEDYFPVLYRQQRNPFVQLARHPLDLEADPPRVDLLGYRGRIDYVLLLWPAAAPPGDPDVLRLQRQLAAGYERVHSSPRGLAELYRARRPGIFTAAYQD